MRDSLLMATVRSVWLYTAMFNINLKVQHIRGKDNYYADILSRWPVYEHNNNDSIVAILKSCQWHTVQIVCLFQILKFERKLAKFFDKLVKLYTLGTALSLFLFS